MLSEADTIARLCTACGLCCNGVLFADVELQAEDDASALEKLGLPLKRLKTKTKMPQPCAALNGCLCRNYAQRPSRCRTFECLQLLKVKSGETAPDNALMHIRKARQLAERAEHFLKELGHNHPKLSLSQRYRRCVRDAENGDWRTEQLETLAELQMIVHKLTAMLQREFYP